MTLLLVINSNLSLISHRFRDMHACLFSVKNAHFLYPFYLTPNLKMLLLHYMAEILTEIETVTQRVN